MNALKDSVMGVVYANSGLDEQVKKYQLQLDKGKTKDIDAEIKQLEKESADAKGKSNTIGFLKFSKDYYEKEQERIDKEIKDLKKKRDNGDYDLTDKEKQALQNRIDILSNITAATSDVLAITNAFGDVTEGNTTLTADDFLEKIDVDAINNAYADSAKAGAREYINQLEALIKNTNNNDLKKIYQDKIDKVMGSMDYTASISWGNLSSDLGDMSSDLQKMNSIMEELNENGSISLDTFADLCDILDGINLEDIFKTGQMDNYLEALDKLNLGFDASTGMITAEGDAMKGLQEIQEVATKAQIQNEIDKLSVKKAELQSELAMYSVEQEANQALIDYLSKNTQAKLKLSDIEKKGNELYAESSKGVADTIMTYYEGMAEDASTWATATITEIGKVGEAFNKLMSGDFSKADAQNLINEQVKKLK